MGGVRSGGVPAQERVGPTRPVGHRPDGGEQLARRVVAKFLAAKRKMADQSPEAVISMEQPKQVVTFSNVKGLNIRLLNCTDVTINGRDVLDSFGAVQDVPATFTDDQPEEEPTRLGRRRRSELLEQTDLVCDHVGAIDDAASSVSQAVKETLASNGLSGLTTLYDSAERLEKILKEADIQVASFTQRMVS